MTKTCGCVCGEEQKGLQSPADAIMAVSILALSTDGKLHKKEMDCLRRMTASCPMFDGVQHIPEYIACIAEAIAGRGTDCVLREAAGALPKPLRETAYAWAVRIVMADHKVLPAEHAFLTALGKALGVHGTLAGKIKGVIAILDRTA